MFFAPIVKAKPDNGYLNVKIIRPKLDFPPIASRQWFDCDSITVEVRESK